ncbi:MAG: YeeE/YedE family protein [Proteobacteria bacterium]|nr:YeeE/YedE family protein [Pseudomonadota bacterium]
MPGDIFTLSSAVLVGLVLGFVLQRGRFRLNMAFTSMITPRKDFTIFRAYLLSLVVAILGANLIQDLGWLIAVDPSDGEVVTKVLYRQGFAPVANILGGYLFGMGMVLANGCASGILYRCGQGFTDAWLAFLAFFLGLCITKHGWLKPLYAMSASVVVRINGKVNPALWDLFGGGMEAKWITIGVITIIIGIFILRGKPFGTASKGYYWSITGLFLGVITIIAWWASTYWGGRPRGLSFTGPTSEFFLSLLAGDPMVRRTPVFNFFGLFETTWASLYVVAVPMGAFFSAKLLKEFRLFFLPREELLSVFIGGLMMGIGAAVGRG